MMDDERDVMQVELLLGVPWVVGYPPSPCPPHSGRTLRGFVPQGEGSEAEAAEAGRVGWVFVGLAVAWFVVTAVLFVAGALMPVADNALAMVVVVTGLVLAALVAVTCPRSSDDDGEVFWTLGREPAVVGQCTPSRVTLTGGER